MTQWLNNTFPPWLLALIIVGGGAFLTWLAVRFRHRGVQPGRPDMDNDLTGVFVLILAGMYGVLVAFTIFIVWTNSARAEAVASTQAGQLSALVRQSINLPQPGQHALQEALRAYTESVIHDEWPAMAHSMASPVSAKLFNNIYQIVYHLPAGAVSSDMSTELTNLSESRTELILLSGAALPGLFLVVLSGAALLVIGLSVFFFSEIPRAHGLMAVAASVLILGSLCLIVLIDYPFTGIKVQPDAFERALDIINSVQTGQL